MKVSSTIQKLLLAIVPVVLLIFSFSNNYGDTGDWVLEQAHRSKTLTIGGNYDCWFGHYKLLANSGNHIFSIQDTVDTNVKVRSISVYSDQALTILWYGTGLDAVDLTASTVTENYPAGSFTWDCNANVDSVKFTNSSGTDANTYTFVRCVISDH